MPEVKTIWQILEEYCAEIKYGEIHIKISIHDGRGTAFEEIQPPVRKFREIKLEK